MGFGHINLIIQVGEYYYISGVTSSYGHELYVAVPFFIKK